MSRRLPAGDGHTARLQALLGPAQGGQVRISPASTRQLGPLARIVAVIAGRVSGGGPPNIFTTLGRHPRLFRAWLRYSARLMPFGQLPRCDTELVILRVAWRCHSAYEWHQHVPLGLRVGLTPDEIATAADGPPASSLTDRQPALLAVSGRAARRIAHSPTQHGRRSSRASAIAKRSSCACWSATTRAWRRRSAASASSSSAPHASSSHALHRAHPPMADSDPARSLA